MNDIDSVICSVLKKMGIEPNKPARWKPHYYISKSCPPIGGKRQDGWICSRCGKHSYVRKKVCDGCNSEMSIAGALKEEVKKYAEDKEQPMTKNQAQKVLRDCGIFDENNNLVPAYKDILVEKKYTEGE